MSGGTEEVRWVEEAGCSGRDLQHLRAVDHALHFLLHGSSLRVQHEPVAEALLLLLLLPVVR